MQTNERANGVAEATQRLAKANLDAQRTVWERLVEAQESQAELAQSMFESTLGSFRTQAEQNLDVWQEVLEQARKGQGAAQVLGKESMHAYADFLDSFSSTTGRARGQPRGVPGKDSLQNGEGPGICCISSVLIFAFY